MVRCLRLEAIERATVRSREHEGQTLRADPFYVRADAELGVALVAVRGTRPDGSDLELPFESWWFRFEAGRVRQAWSL